MINVNPVTSGIMFFYEVKSGIYYVSWIWMSQWHWQLFYFFSSRYIFYTI